MEDSIYHMTLKLLIKLKILSSFMQHYNGHHYIALPESVNHLWFNNFIT